MSSEEHHPKDPIEAHREGLEAIKHKPHHPTTEHEKSPHVPLPPHPETPGEEHRDGRLPNQKR